MKNEQLMLEEVKRYLNDDTYDYALMIDGDWGSGKTYFVKEVLDKELNAIEKDGIDNRVRYYSVCGVETLSELKETMIYDLLERKADEVHELVTRDFAERRAAMEATEDDGDSEKKSHVEQVFESKKEMTRDLIEEQREERKKRIASFKGTRAFRVGVDIGGKLLTGLLKSKVPFLNAVDAGDYLSDVEDLQEYVFIFDDIERCSFSVTSLLCFINELVEHVHAKVILVANEQALKKKQQTGRMMGMGSHSSGNGYMEYLGIREKLVGTVLKYRNDEKDVFEKLIRSELAEGSLFRERALGLVPGFCAMMEEAGHHSLRTVQYFLSRVKNIEEMLKKEMENETAANEISTETVEKMLSELFGICLDFRAVDTEQKEQPEAKDYHFRSLADYVETGIPDVERLAEEMDGFPKQ